MEEKTARQQRLLSAIRAVAEERFLRDTLRRLLDEALAGVGGRLGWVAVAEGEGLRVAAVQGVERPYEGELIPFGVGLTGRAFREGRPVYAPDVSLEKEYWKVAPEVRSEFAVPLLWAGERVGVLNVESTTPDGLSEEAREFVEALAGLAAGVVARSVCETEVRVSLRRMERELGERLEEMGALIAAARAISSSLDLEHITKAVLERAAAVSRADFCHLLLEDERSGVLKIYTSTDLPGGLSEGGAVDVSRGVTGWVARNRQPLLVGDVQADSRYVPWREETKSELAVPLLDGDRLVGVLNLESSRRDAFDRYDLEMASALAGLITAAVRNARLYSHLKKAKEGLELTEGLRAAGEAAADVVHWVANKVGAFPEAIGFIKRLVEFAPEDKRGLFRRLTNHMEETVREILEVKRSVMDAARPLAPEPVSVPALVREFAARARFPGVSVSVSGPERATVFADRYALVRMLDNALQNAARHCRRVPEAEVTIRWASEGDITSIEVIDCGPGFPEDLLRLGPVPRPGTQGTGMGLWLSARLAERMGGALELGNRPEGGARIVIRLPAVEDVG